MGCKRLGARCRALAVIAALVAIGYGFAAGGVLGAATGLVAAVGVGSGLAIARAEQVTGVVLTGASRTAQRIGGILAAIGCLLGAYYGGWRFGWAWGAVGYAAGAVSGLLARALMAGRGPDSSSTKNRSIASEAVPSRFDLDDVLHVTILDEVRDKYGALLADESHPYSQCMYRPSSLLPYPKEVIREALEALLDFVEGRRDSRLLDASIRNPEVADTIRTTLLLLEDFLDVAQEQLPAEPTENARVGLLLQQSRQ